MDKKVLRKNKLDLEYHGEAQKANTFLILLTTGTLGFIGTFLWLNEYIFQGVLVATLVSVVGATFYWKRSNRMREILEEIENI